MPKVADLGLFRIDARHVQLELALYAFDIVLTGEEDEDVAWRKEVMYLEDGFDRSFDIVLRGCIEVFDVDSMRPAFYIEDFGTVGPRQLWSALISTLQLGLFTYHRTR